MDNSLQKQMQEITDRLEKGVQEIFSGENYKKYLAAMSKFHNYSLNNLILIMLQKADASLIAGYQAWKKLHGRQVMRGEKGIKILAPSPYKVKRMVDKIDPETQKPVKGKDGKIIKEEKEIVVPAYRMVTVFDVSQTEGRELPTIGANELTGAVDGYDSFLKALDKSCPVPIKFKEIEGKAKGYFSLTENEIAVKQGMSEIQTVKTIIHEMAHQKLHSGLDAVKQTRSSKEVEAESIAYVVSQHYGIDTSDYSFSYVVGWSDGKETTELKNSLDVIRKTASEMISDIDGALEEIHLVNSRDKNTKISVLTNLHDKQERIRKESDRSSLSFTKTKNNQDYVKESRKDIQL